MLVAYAQVGEKVNLATHGPQVSDEGGWYENLKGDPTQLQVDPIGANALERPF